MTAQVPSSGMSALDRAHALYLSQKPEDALRLAASLLNATPEHVGAAALVARLLFSAERATIAGAIASQVIAWQIARGDLAAAWCAAQTAIDAGGTADATLGPIAQAFGKGSPRLGQAAPAPPPLPSALEVAPMYAKLSGPALLDAAEKAAGRFLKTKDPRPTDASLPILPLFGALEPAKLLKLLGRIELRTLNAGEYVVREGEAGNEAFVIARGVVNVVRGTTPTLLAVLGPGAIFGEMALVSEAPRAASAVAVEPVDLLSISRAALEKLGREEPSIGEELGAFCYGRMIANLLRHSSVLSGVAPTARKQLVSRFTTERFATGAALVRQGGSANRMFLIASGSVQVRGTDSEGDSVVLAELGPGEVVGEISLVLRRPANADVVALCPTVALALSSDQFQESIREHPTLLRELYNIAIKRADDTLSVLAQQAVDASDVVLL